MTPADAARLLELPEHATSEQVEARFHELRAKLEEKIGKAPTPGLKAKYRESLDEVTAAFETLTLAADSSALPVLKKDTGDRILETGGSGSTGAAATPPRGGESGSRKSRIENQKSGREFLIVAVIAVAVLGGGAWWVMKTRAEKAEQARIALDEKRIAADAKAEADRVAAAARAEADRKAEESRLAAEARRREEEEEKVRAANAARAAEAAREAKAAEVRAKLVELKLAWEATEQDARLAERRAAQLRSDVRSASMPAAAKRTEAEAAAQQAFADWFVTLLARHPARIARLQAEELLSARQIDSAEAALAKAVAAQQTIDAEIADARKSFLSLTTSTRVSVSPEGATWELTDAYGEIHRGVGPAEVGNLPFGSVTLRASLDGYQAKEASGTLVRGQPAPSLAVQFVLPRIEVNTIPQGATVRIGGVERGVTPLVAEVPKPGTYQIEVSLAGYEASSAEVAAAEGGKANPAFYLLNDDVGLMGFAIGRDPGSSDLKITHVGRASPADEAGLQVGMTITGIERNGRFESMAEASLFEILQVLAGKPGTELRLMARSGTKTPREYQVTRRRRADVERTAETTGLLRFFNIILPSDAQEPTELQFPDGRRYRLGNAEYCAVRLAGGLHSLSLVTGRARVNTKIFVQAGEVAFYMIDPLNKRVPYAIMMPEPGNEAVAVFKKVDPLPNK